MKQRAQRQSPDASIEVKGWLLEEGREILREKERDVARTALMRSHFQAPRLAALGARGDIKPIASMPYK